MSLNPNQQVTKLKQALAEIRANREHFSDAAFSQIVMLMLDNLRRLQTVTPNESTKADEMRLVTVMFIDVKDSTEIVQQMDPSDWKIMIDTAHEQIAEIVAQWDGQIGQYLGDGVLCFFGAQRSRGDDAPHAVSCALQIQSALSKYAEKVAELHGVEFAIRIGISTGRVIVGMIGSHTVKQELLALGAPTNLAARLQSIAPVGGVLIDSITYNRIRRDYITQAQAPVMLRGFEKPVNNYVVLARRTQPATQFTATHIAGIELPLVGRDDDLAAISHMCDRALQENRCEVIIINGDVGMGKSRILQETIHLTEGHFQHIVMTSQYESRSQSQNLLWDMVMTQCDVTPTMSQAVINHQIDAYITDMWDDPDALQAARAIAYLAGFLDDKPNDDVIEWALRWFEGVAQNMPIVITVDNLQWTDGQSLGFLESLAARLQDTASVIIAAGRSEYQVNYPNFMKQYPHTNVVQLTELESDATLSIIQTVFNQIERIPTTLAYSINERVEGNPLFVHEYIGMLFDNNVFRAKDEGGWRFNIIMLDAALNTLPNGLLSILQARLDDLPDQARQIMQIAAISGRIFWQSGIRVLTDMDNIDTWIEHLLTRGMIVKSTESIFEGEQQYRFKHSLYHNVAYEMIPRGKREDHHKLMSLWLLEHIAGQMDYYPLLADQFSASGEYLAALYTYLEAVEVQLQGKRELKALSFIDRALGLANKISRDEALAVVAKLWAYRAQALVRLERYEEGSAASQSALMLLNELSEEQLVDVRILAERILGLAYLSLGRYPEAYDALTRAYVLVPRTATAQIAEVLLALGTMYYRQGRLEESLAYLKRSYATASITQELPLISEALVTLGMVEVEQGNFSEAMRLFDEALQIYRALHLVPEQAHTLAQIGLVYLTTLNYGKAYEYFSDAEYLNTTFGYANMLVQGYRGLSLIMLGRNTQGKGLLLDAVSNVPRDAHMQHRLQLASITGAVILGDYVQAHDQALAFAQHETMNPITRSRTLMWLGYASFNLNTSDAMHYLQEALKIESNYGGRDVWLCHAMIANCAEDEETRQAHYQQAAELITQRAASLTNSPDMRESFLSNRFVANVLKNAGKVDSADGS